MSDGYEVLAHTADVGVRARGPTPASVVQTLTRAMAELAGIWQPAEQGEKRSIEVLAGDLAGGLVDWLNEILYLHDSAGKAIGGCEVIVADPDRILGSITLVELDARDGTQIKAATWHGLRFDRTDSGWTADVYFDV